MGNPEIIFCQEIFQIYSYFMYKAEPLEILEKDILFMGDHTASDNPHLSNANRWCIFGEYPAPALV